MAEPVATTTRSGNGSGSVKRPRLDHVEEPILFHMVEQQTKIENKLLSVELFDKDGDVLWSCDDIRKGHYTKLKRDVETPSYEDERMFWRKHVWTLPVRQRKHGRSEFELHQRNQISKVRIGLHEWEAKIAEDIGMTFEYDCTTQLMHTVSLPIVMSDYSQRNWDVLGKDSLYVTGSYTVTDPDMIAVSDSKTWENESIFDSLRDHVPMNQTFPGVHDELRVREVHLAISGTVSNTLKLFNLYDEEWVEEPDADPNLRWW